MNYSQVLWFAWAVGSATLMGYFLTSLLLQPRLSSGLTLALAPSVGVGICSLIDYVFRRNMFTVEAIVAVILFGLWLWIRRPNLNSLRALASYRFPIVGVLLVATLAGTLSMVYFSRVVRIPNGGWDGWAIWNSHARSIHRDPRNWKDHIQHTFHPDYPLLVPITVVRSWRYAGAETPGLSGLSALLLTFSGVWVLGAALGEARSRLTGGLLAAVLLSTPYFLTQGAYQEADVPLSIYILCSLALFMLHFDRAPDKFGVVALSGFMAGCAGWTKNEGLLFIFAMSLAVAVPMLQRVRGQSMRRFAAFAAGLAVPLAVILAFKLLVAPQTDLVENRNYDEIVGRILDPNRYAMISATLVDYLWTFGGWMLHPMLAVLAFLMVTGIDRRILRNTGWLTGVATILIVLYGFYWVYVLTPMDLRWHLDSSLRRLILQLWPATLFLAGITTVRRESAEISDSHAG